MRDELDAKLVEKYPKIFAARYKSMQETCMCWGFEHGDGWYNIINALCANIQHHIDWKRKQRATDLRRLRAARKGRDALLKFMSPDRDPMDWQKERADEILKELENGTFNVTEKVTQVVADQVKEKFGTLRFYFHGGDEYCRGVAAMAESMTVFTCEECGAPGTQNRGGWIKTLCETHQKERDERYSR